MSVTSNQKDHHEDQLYKAEEANKLLSQKVHQRWYPTFHIAAPAGWINDPNGLIYYRGRYHAFYQHHPYSTQWGPMHWGHATSEDLVHWKREPIALAPSLEADSGGVYSGSTVIGDDGRLYAYYTGNKWLNPDNRDEGNVQVQCLAISSDGITFEKQGVVVENQNLPNFRDPKVFREGNTWFMVFGATSEEGRGQVHMYTSKDMLNWSFDRILYEFPSADVFMLECPDLFRLDDHWVLVFCPERPTPHGYEHRNTHNAGYIVGNWAPGTEFSPLTSYMQIDRGHNFYAPQTFLAPDGRRIMMGWMGSFGIPVASAAEDGWAGQLTVPMELSLTADLKLKHQPVAELAAIFGEPVEETGFKLEANEERVLTDDASAYDLEIVLDLSSSTADRIGLQLALGESGNHTYLGYDALAGTVFLDRRLAGIGDKGYRAVPIDGQGELTVRVLADRASYEVFINGGVESLSSLAFAPEGRRRVVLLAESGTAVVKRVRFAQKETPEQV